MNDQERFEKEMERIGGPVSEMNPSYFADQYNLMAAGIRDGRISDNAISAWENIGKKLY